VMRYEDVEIARVKRAEKEQAKVKGKGRPGRKRKSTGQEADTQEPEARHTTRARALTTNSNLIGETRNT
jgi:hypothetical protein